MFCICGFFFFQAEDGIRDSSVTGVQTCALPISRSSGKASSAGFEVAGESVLPTRGLGLARRPWAVAGPGSGGPAVERRAPAEHVRRRVGFGRVPAERTTMRPPVLQRKLP